MGSKPQPAKTPDLFVSATPPEQDRPPHLMSGFESRELGDAVGRRTRSAIALAPILEVERTKAQRDLDLSEHDLRMLCLVILDVVIDKMGFGTGAGHADILNATAPIVRSAAPGISPDRAEQIVDLALAALLNDRERRQQFVEPYAALDDGSVVWREFAFRLLEERQLPESDERVFRASSEAINLYTEMLGYNLEDAAHADLAVLKYQSERGRLDDAIRTARQAQIRGKAYAERIRLALELARRDADQAKWTTDVLPTVIDALEHIQDRLRKEGELRAGLEQQRDQGGNDDLSKINRLLNEIEKSERTNLELHNLLITANDTFREEHTRQRLRRSATALHVNLQPDIFLPLLSTEMPLAAQFVSSCWGLLAGHNTPALVGIEQLWGKLLAAPMECATLEADVTMPTTEIVQDIPPIFDRDAYIAVRDFLRAELNEPRQLSELLEIAGDRGLSSPAQRLFVLLTMEQFGAEGERMQLEVRKTGSRFSIDGFLGDDVHVSRAKR
jgi:hypothetical protein